MTQRYLVTIIDACHECPYRRLSKPIEESLRLGEHLVYVCSRKRPHKVIDSFSGIPEFCPLQKAE